MGQTRVDLLHLLEDLRDAYPGSIEETIVAETVANALDSGAGAIAFHADPAAAALVITDDGAGMTRAELRRYHDLATTSKRRGQGIGFAGVGIKLALLECDQVVTETRRAGRAHATSWRLASRQKAPWDYVDPPGLVTGEAGTGLRLTLKNPLSALLDPGWLVTTLLRGFAPLFDPTFDEILGANYPGGVEFSVNGRTVPRAVAAPHRLLGDHALGDRVPVVVKLPRKRKPSAVGWLARADGPLADAERGVAVSTLGKVIRRGWDWLGVTPAAGDRITGLVEAPGLAEALQLNKADFIRTGARGAVYLAYRKAIQEALSAQLAAWGEPGPPPRERRPRTRPLERDLEKVLVDMADDFPLLGALVERRAGGQRRIPMGSPDPRAAAAASSWAPGEELATTEQEAPSQAPEPAPPGAGGPDDGDPAGDAAPSGARDPRSAHTRMTLPGRPAARRRGRYSLEVRFESRPDSDAMGRLVESTVWVNDAHPAFRRAAASRAEGYHVALSVAMALATLAADPTRAHDFITAFMARWGEAADGKGKGKRAGTARRVTPL
jgi:hypothetical protein